MFKNNKYIFSFIISAALILASASVFADSFQDGINAYQSGNYGYAEIYFKNAYKQYPSNDKIKYYLAITYVQNKKIPEAQSLYANIITTSSNQDVIRLAKAGLKLIGGSSSYSNSGSRITKAILNVNAVGNILLVDNVALNDKMLVKYVFDTGASYTTISRELARKLNISTINSKTIKIMTGSGYVEAPLVKINKIEIQGLTSYNVEALVTDLPVHTNGTAGNLAGLLGLSFLKDYKFTVDRQKNQIILEK